MFLFTDCLHSAPHKSEKEHSHETFDVALLIALTVLLLASRRM